MNGESIGCALLFMGSLAAIAMIPTQPWFFVGFATCFLLFVITFMLGEQDGI